MSSSDPLRPRALVAVGLALAVLALPACTARPLYASADNSGLLEPGGALAALRGRIAVSEANSRTDQIVRNALLSRLNQGTRVAQPLYEVRLTVTGGETGIAIESGGALSSALYRMTARYQLVRLSDNQVVDTASRTTTVPFDRTAQLYQTQRALINARQQAGEDVAAQLEIALVRALEKAGV
ncbi:hypothetical protein VQ045_06910 [Aurantimonas sp. E1-2-R+4]|uniref:hypothetical protein n=1 Tax=Aurantimonas sp. E1-2-R+4 TaxID=3113714 RepID=UPI002F91DEF6